MAVYKCVWCAGCSPFFLHIFYTLVLGATARALFKKAFKHDTLLTDQVMNELDRPGYASKKAPRISRGAPNYRKIEPTKPQLNAST